MAKEYSHKFSRSNLVFPFREQHFKQLKHYLNFTGALEKDIFSGY
jgi:hypothetical protein